MKKNMYITPEIEVTNLQLNSALLTGSLPGIHVKTDPEPITDPD